VDGWQPPSRCSGPVSCLCVLFIAWFVRWWWWRRSVASLVIWWWWWWYAVRCQIGQQRRRGSSGVGPAVVPAVASSLSFPFLSFPFLSFPFPSLPLPLPLIPYPIPQRPTPNTAGGGHPRCHAGERAAGHGQLRLRRRGRVVGGQRVQPGSVVAALRSCSSRQLKQLTLWQLRAVVPAEGAAIHAALHTPSVTTNSNTVHDRPFHNQLVWFPADLCLAQPRAQQWLQGSNNIQRHPTTPNDAHRRATTCDMAQPQQLWCQQWRRRRPCVICGTNLVPVCCVRGLFCACVWYLGLFWAFVWCSVLVPFGTWLMFGADIPKSAVTDDEACRRRRGWVASRFPLTLSLTLSNFL